MHIKKFNPLVFLASLGAGGIAVMPFVLMQYTIEHGEGLITRTQLWSHSMPFGLNLYYYFLELVMIVFAAIHLVLTVYFTVRFVEWLKKGEVKELIDNPLKNTSVLTPLISLLMTMNVFIGPVRYFIPVVSSNFQSLFAPAMLFWSAIFFVAMWLEIKLLKISFEKNFDMGKIHFGWLLHPFLLGMLSTVGTGIAAMAKDPTIANSAAFLSMISFSMGLFLFVVKLITLFKNHFSSPNLPEKTFLPGFLIVVPNITLFAITAFRLGHFLEHQHHFHLDAFFYFVIGLSFAFEVWYMLFGLSLLSQYFKTHHFREFYPTQWGLICPLVAFVVLGAFTYNVVLPSALLYTILVVVTLVAIAFYFELLSKHVKCSKMSEELYCEKI